MMGKWTIFNEWWKNGTITQVKVFARKKEGNKAVYTTASVAYGWAGAVTEVRSPFGVFSHCVTDGPTDRRTDGPTE